MEPQRDLILRQNLVRRLRSRGGLPRRRGLGRDDRYRAAATAAAPSASVTVVRKMFDVLDWLIAVP
jgi:hypothetical protein